MGTTSENITLLQYAMPKVAKEELLAALNEAVQMIYGNGSNAAEYIDPSTGWPPFLTTVAGQFVYDLDADVRAVKAIFMDYPQRQGSYYGDRWFLDTYRWNSREYSLAAVECRPKTPASNAQVIFKNDPGDTTDKYYMLYEMEHPTIDSVDVQMRIPDDQHFSVRRIVKIMLAAENYGEGYDPEREINKISARIRNNMNKGSSIVHVGRTNLQPESRNYGYGRMRRAH